MIFFSVNKKQFNAKINSTQTDVISPFLLVLTSQIVTPNDVSGSKTMLLYM